MESDLLTAGGSGSSPLDSYLQAERRILEALQAGPLAVHWVDAAGRLIQANPLAWTMLGLAREDVVGRRWVEFHADPGVAEDLVRRLANGEKLRDWPARLRHKDGSLRYVLVDADGAREGAVASRCFVRDVTEQQHATMALRESEERFQALADAAPVMIWESGVDARCTYFNKAWLDFSGRTLQQELGEGWAEGVHPEDFQRCFDTYLAAFAAREPFRMEYRLLNREGEYRWILDQGTPRVQPDGKFLGFVGSCVDITEQRRAIEALSQNERRLRLVLERAPVFLWLCDGDLNLAPAGGGSRLQARASEPGRSSVKSFFEGAGQVSTAEAAHRRALGGAAATFEAQIDGRFYACFTQPLNGAAGSGAIGMALDITERKDLERALAEKAARLESDRVELESSYELAGERIALLEEQTRTRHAFHQMHGKSEPMQEVFRRLRIAGQSDTTVLITGESGTGKELAARAIHSLSGRKDRPFLGVNCSAIPDTLLESELFGHVKGAFTGAVRDKVGLFQAAEGGTLFLDEVGDMSPLLQLKLLRVLQEREIRRVGDDRAHKVNIRLITATNRDMRALIAEGKIREDFYYRVRVLEIVLPSLRERKEDIGLLVDQFIREFCRVYRKRVKGINRDALDCLARYAWPGNVRELRNSVEQMVVTLRGAWITLRDVPPHLALGEDPSKRADVRPPASPERDKILEALRLCGNNRTRAAKKLGISRGTLWAKMLKYGLS